MKTSESKKVLIASRKAAGLCIQCGQPSDGKTRCSLHASAARQTSDKIREKRKKANQCQTCGKPPMPNRTVCEACSRRGSEASMRRYEKNKQADKCRYCGTETNGQSRCEGCKKTAKASYRKMYDRRKAEGKCYFCNQQAVEGKIACVVCSDKASKFQKQRNNRRRLQVLSHYGLACACCGEAVYEFLEIDHIEGGGAAHRREIGRGNLYKWLIRSGFPEGFRTLCSNCNHARGCYGYCPHERNKK